MSEKSHVSLEAAICPICGKEHETGTILLDKRMKASMERTTLTGYALCPEHQKMKDDGYIALVGIDEKLSHTEGKTTVTLKDAHRTGDLIHIRTSAWEFFFEGHPVPPQGVCFVDKALVEMLKEQAGYIEPKDPGPEGEEE